MREYKEEGLKEMNLRKFFIFSFIFLSMNRVAAEPVRDFLVSCGYGILIGAGAGVVTLAFEKNPSEHTNNIARGASLGLYGGIGYSLYKMNQPQKNQDVYLTMDSQNNLAQLNYLYRF